jgi:hypothetical protein
LVILLQLRTALVSKKLTELIAQRCQSLLDISELTSQNIRGSSHNDLHNEALEVVGLEEHGSVEDAASKVLDVYASEAVDLAGVTTDVQQTRVLGSVLENIEKEVYDGELIAYRATVPVLRNALPALVDLEVTRLVTLDTEKAGEDLSGEVAFGVLAGVVGHHSRREGIRGRRDQDTSEGGVEEVTVGLLRVLEPFVVERCESGVLLGGRGVERDGPPVFFKAAENNMEVVSGHVEIASRSADIGLILVVRTTETRRGIKDTTSVENILAEAAGTTDGVTRTGGQRVTIEDGTVDSEETSKIKTHAVDLVGGLDDGLHIRNTVTRQVSMVGKRVQTRTGASLVTSLEVRCVESMLTRDADALLLGIELCSSLLLCVGAISCLPLFLLSSERAGFGGSLSVLAIGLDLFGAELGESESGGEKAGCCEP